MDTPMSFHSAVSSSRQGDGLKAGAMGSVFVDELNGKMFRLIYQGQRNGLSCLPYWFGLDADKRQEFRSFLNLKNPSLDTDFNTPPWEDVRQNLLEMRREEWLEVRDLLLQYVEPNRSSFWMADTVAAGCLGGNHLWRDLGLPNRQSLGELLNGNFPILAARNTKDMKWKKFFYKQLCEADGSYVCRAPTCEQCTAYDDCFGPED